MSERRLQLHDWLMAQAELPYVWGAKGELYEAPEGPKVPAYDCSGLVTCGLLAVGNRDWRQTHNAQRLWDELEHLDEPSDVLPLDLAFYGALNGSHVLQINHVMVLMPDGRVYGATGGGPSVNSVRIAKLKVAKVQYRPSVDYRRDFRGYRRLPLP